MTHCSKRPSESPLAPDFTLKTIKGQEITLSSLKGKVILLDFWATWCGPCKESIPHLIAIYKDFQNKGVEVIGLSMDRGEEKIIHNFVNSFDIPYPILIAPDDLAKKYGVTGLPTTFLIDKEGKVRDRIVGFNTAIAQKIVTQISHLVSEKP
ncbi:MAG: TlpA disulfide reductase family protein [Thermodesulfobacteriota bacterium]